MKLEQELVTVTIIPDSNNTSIGKCCFSLFPLIFCGLRIHRKSLIWQEKNLWYETNGKELALSCEIKPKKNEAEIFLIKCDLFLWIKKGFSTHNIREWSSKSHWPIYTLYWYMYMDRYIYEEPEYSLYQHLYTGGILRPLETTNIYITSHNNSKINVMNKQRE